MSEFDSDIEFDFFEDLETREEAPPQERRAGRPPGGPPPRRPHTGPGLTPTLRLIGLIAFAILVIVLLVFWVESCQGSGKKKSYSTYMEKVSTIANDSVAISKQLRTALTTAGIKPNALAQKLNGLAQQQQQDLAATDQLKPPGPIRQQSISMQEALQLRVKGLRGLSDTFRRTAGSKNATGAAAQLALYGQRLVSSDTVWLDLFRIPAIAELKDQGITGVAVPASKFVDDPSFGTPGYWKPVFERVNGSVPKPGTTGGFRGTMLVSTKALPSGTVLSTSQETTVKAGTNLGFEVTVEDSGDSQEVGIKVTLTIEQASPITQTQVIDSINPGQQKTVTFTNLQNVEYTSKVTVKVDVAPVPGEARTDNNSASYPVIFSL